MRVSWVSLRAKFRGLRDEIWPSEPEVVHTTPTPKRRVKTTGTTAGVETPHVGMEIIKRLTAKRCDGEGTTAPPAMLAELPTRQQPPSEETVDASKKRKREAPKRYGDDTEEPHPKRRAPAPKPEPKPTPAPKPQPKPEPEPATCKSRVLHLNAAASHSQAVTTGRRKCKKPGDDRDDTKTNGTVQFGNRLYNYFNFLADHNKISPANLLAQDTFRDGRLLLPDIDQAHPMYTAEQELVSNKCFDKTAEKQAIYRIAKSQAAIAAAIYCEHNLRRVHQASERGEKAKAKDLFNFGPATIQYFLNRDARVFADVLRAWKALGFFPQDMFTNARKNMVSEEMRAFAVADRARIYNKYVAWEDENRAGGKILVRL